MITFNQFIFTEVINSSKKAAKGKIALHRKSFEYHRKKLPFKYKYMHIKI